MLSLHGGFSPPVPERSGTHCVHNTPVSRHRLTDGAAGAHSRASRGIACTDALEGYAVRKLTPESSRWHSLDLGNGVCAVPEGRVRARGPGGGRGRWALATLRGRQSLLERTV